MKITGESTLCFLIKENRILLGMKKRGFGIGKWNGIGGKRHKNDKDIIETMIRETEEEIGVIPIEYKLVAKLKFIWEDKAEWNQRVSVFLVTKWKGKPIESEEEKPKWWSIDKLPFNKMWEDDPTWLPAILKGKKIRGKYFFDKENRIKKYEVKGGI